ncbi:hypothetical protein BCR44DRAFT_1430905, partial [Catenaria anguillulae PL171]
MCSTKISSTPLLLLLLALLAAIAPSALAEVPPVAEFCSESNCAAPNPSVITNLNRRFTETFGPGPAKCGDNVCDISRGETCRTCPQDCGGACTTPAPTVRCRGRNQFALTFDDGPSEFTRQTVELLNREKIKATFFVNGYNVFRHGDLTKFAYESGHTIGSHTYSHRSLNDGHGQRDRKFTSLSYNHMLGELILNDEVIFNLIGRRPRIVRPPFLEFNAASMAFMETVGHTAVNINLDTDDWRVTSTDAVLANLRAVWASTGRAQPSWIHLQHDSLGYSMNALPQLIAFLRAQGVEFVTIDQCLGVPAYRGAGDSPFLAKRIEGHTIKGAQAGGNGSASGSATPTATPTSSTDLAASATASAAAAASVTPAVPTNGGAPDAAKGGAAGAQNNSAVGAMHPIDVTVMV